MAIMATFSEDDLRALSGSRSFDRAQHYLDAVHDLEVRNGCVTATVYGGADYGVTLVTDVEGLSGECDCPYGREGNFCKHCVAVGLAVLCEAATPSLARARAGKARENLDTWLARLSRDELLGVLREQVAEDRELRRRLEVRAAADRLQEQAAGDSVDVGAVRDRIADLFDTSHYGQHGYVEYRDAFTYASHAGEAVTAIRSLIDSGHARQAVVLTREAIALLGEALAQIDDSSGAVGAVAAELEQVHRQACDAGGADPMATAEWLADHLLGARSFVADVDVHDYWDILGEAGQAKFRQLVAEAWQRNPSGWAEKSLMQQMVREAGDLDALITVLAADLDPRGSTHLQIAKELDAVGRGAEALEWAERGLRDAAGPHSVDDRLVEYVTDRYLQSSRQADAVTLRRERFRANRSLAAYQKLRATAQTAGCWDAERSAALGLLRTDASTGLNGIGYGGLHHRHSVLVDVLIDDRDLDAAWQAAQQRANQQQWLTLADLVADHRPADALPVYRQAIESLKQFTGDDRYHQMATLLLQARACHQRLGTDDEFATYLTALRADQKRKRNLMKILNEHGL